MYSTEHGFSIVNKEKGLVRRDGVTGLANCSYGVHQAQNKFDGREFKGIKFRLATRLLNSRHMASIFMQVPGLGDKEMHPDRSLAGVEILKIEGLAADGSVGLESTTLLCSRTMLCP